MGTQDQGERSLPAVFAYPDNEAFGPAGSLADYAAEAHA